MKFQVLLSYFYNCGTMNGRKNLTVAEKESLVVEAIDGINFGRFITAYDAAKQLQISATTVYRRLNGHLSRAQARVSQQNLTEAEEKVLVKYIKQLTKCGYPLGFGTLRQLATRLKWRRVQKKIDIEYLDTLLLKNTK